MAGYAFQNALGEFLRPKRIIVWLFVAIGLFAIASTYLKLGGNDNPEDAYATMSSLLLFRLLPLASAIFSSAVLSAEIEQKTIVYMLTRPIPRPVFLAMRTLASAAVVFIVTALSGLGLAIAVYGPSGATNHFFWRDLVAIAVGALAYGSLFVLVSLIINRAMVVSLLFAFAWETSVPNMPGSIYLMSISTHLTAIAQRPSAGSPSGGGGFLTAVANSLGTNTLSPAIGWISMIGLIAFCMGFGAWWFTRFEYLPREDAE
jgi:ABC-2 type transport system permease protein